MFRTILSRGNDKTFTGWSDESKHVSASHGFVACMGLMSLTYQRFISTKKSAVTAERLSQRGPISRFRRRAPSKAVATRRPSRYGWINRFLAYVLLVMAFAHITLNYSFFGTSERADKYAQDLVNTYAGDWIYPPPRDDITVLLLTDQAVAVHQRGHWPASYDFHARVLNTVLNHEPAAVFIDFLWLSQRTETADGQRDGPYLVKTLKRYQAANIPVYMASTPAVKQNWPELDGLVKHVEAQLDIDFVDFVSRSYPVKKNNTATPAFQIARDIRPELFPQSPVEAMDVFWGTLPNKTNLSWMTDQGDDTAVLDVLTSGYSGVKTSVPFTTTLFVRDLLKPVATTSEKASEETDAFIKGKVILYGANLTGVNDLVFTPTRDILPGVYLHAMALDNLFHWGFNYKSANGSGLLQEQGWRHAWNMLMVLPVAVLFALFHRRLHIPRRFAYLRRRRSTGRRFARKHPWLSKMVIAAVLASWFAAWALVEFFWFNVSAATVASYIEFIAVGFFLEKAGLLDWTIDNVLVPVRRHVLGFRSRSATP